MFSWLKAWRRAVSLFRRDGFERALDEEMRFHLEMKTRENVEAGMSPDEAHYAALRRFGNRLRVAEDSREVWMLKWFETLAQDVRYGLRMLAKSPGFTTVAVLTLALGTGANVAIFSVVRAVLLKPLPYPAASRLVVMREYQIGGSSMSVNWLNFLDWQKQNRAFDSMAAYEWKHFSLTGAGEPTLLRAGTVSASFFRLTGARAAAGRLFTASDDLAYAAPTTVLSYRLWEQRFGSSALLVGSTIALSGRAYTVVGVLPPDFRDPITDRRIDLYVPVGLESGRWTSRDQRGSLLVIARRRAGVSLASARSAMDTIEQRLENQYPATNRGIRASVTSLAEVRFGPFRPLLFALLGAVGFVLLIACANVANLLLARATGRRRELAIRCACGAGRARIVRQLLVESALLSGLGGLLGLLLAWQALGPLVRAAPPGIPRLDQTNIDSGVLFFTLLVSVLAGVVAGIAPALQVSRVDLTGALKEGRSVTAGRLSQRLRASLLVGEVALAVVVVVASGLLVRSLIKAQQVSPGFNPDHLLVVELVLPDSSYRAPEKRVAFYDQLEDRFRHLPGIESAGMVLCPPAVGHCWDWFYTVEGHAPPDPGKLPVSAFNSAGPTYFKTLGVPLIAGRFFDRHDDASSRPVVIVNQNFARQWWSDGNALGKRLRLWSAKGTEGYREIVGVVGDVKEDGLDAEQIPEVFMPVAQQRDQAITFVMRARQEPMTLERQASGAVHSLDKDLPIERIQPMTRYIENSLARRSFSTFLLGLFGVLALLLASIGIYGVMSYTVSQRTHEIGVRMALGARRLDVAQLVAAQGLRLALAGTVIGLALALAVSRLLASLLFAVTALDPATYLSAAAVLLMTALLASYLPARRAATVEPTAALRCE